MKKVVCNECSEVLTDWDLIGGFCYTCDFWKESEEYTIVEIKGNKNG